MTSDINPNITREGIEVRPGQVWQSLDKRDRGRKVTVESVEDGKARVMHVKRSTLSISRMHPHSSGWKLVRDVR